MAGRGWVLLKRRSLIFGHEKFVFGLNIELETRNNGNHQASLELRCGDRDIQWIITVSIILKNRKKHMKQRKMV